MARKSVKVKKPLYKKVWFWVVVVLVVGGIGSSLGGEEKDKASNSKDETNVSLEPVSAKDSEPATVKSSTTPEEEETSNATADEQYQAILDEYTLKIQEEAPKLVAEYNAEAPNNQDGLEGLAKLSNDKISNLAEISNDGISQMANVHFKSGTGKYEDYEAWATKLNDVYMTEAQAITDAYMNSAQ